MLNIAQNNNFKGPHKRVLQKVIYLLRIKLPKSMKRAVVEAKSS